MNKVTLQLGDCLELMKALPDKSIDLILCDLPYGTTQNKWDSVIPLPALWEHYKRVAKDNAAVVLFAAQPFGAALVASNYGDWKQTLIWKKNIASNFLNANRQHLAIHEEVHIFCSTVYHPQMMPGKPYKQKRNGKDDSGDCYGAVSVRTDTANNGTRYPQTVLEFARETGKHPTQKPVLLMEYLIKTYSNPGMMILDNTMGSGSTGVAAVNTGRDFVGMEKEPKYFEIAQARIAEAQAKKEAAK